MIKQVKIIFSSIFIASYKLINLNFNSFKSIIFLSKVHLKKQNKFSLNLAYIDRCIIAIDGAYNYISIKGYLFKTKINICGDNNKIIIHSNVKLNNSTIVLRGNDCKIEIGEGSTFGSIQIVCMGKLNYIKIGENCMFAENIDIWATDSHPIYNFKNELVNPSKPIIIGNSVWVGSKSTILKGVKVGSGSIIGMSSVVTKHIEPMTLNVGNPIRCIKTDIRWEREFITS